MTPEQISEIEARAKAPQDSGLSVTEWMGQSCRDNLDLIAYIRELEARLAEPTLTLREPWPHDLSYD